MMSVEFDTAKNVRKVIEQSEAANAGNTKLADRLVSLDDPEAQPIVKGKHRPEPDWVFLPII